MGSAPTAEVPAVDLDADVLLAGEDSAGRIQARGLYEGGRAEHIVAVVGQQPTADDEAILRRRLDGLGLWPRSEPEDQEALGLLRADSEVPHGAAEKVVPAANHYIAVSAGLVTGLLKSESARGRRFWQGEYVHTPGQGVIVGERRAAGDHPVLKIVHVGPVTFHHLPPQRRRREAITVVAEEIHDAIVVRDLGVYQSCPGLSADVLVLARREFQDSPLGRSTGWNFNYDEQTGMGRRLPRLAAPVLALGDLTAQEVVGEVRNSDRAVHFNRSLDRYVAASPCSPCTALA